MKFFVTGGTGFIGSHFVQHALQTGHDVTALRRSSQSTPKINLHFQPTWVEKPLKKVRKSDLFGVDTLVHFAACGVSPQPATWSSCFDFNFHQSLCLLQKAQAAGVRRAVIAGTCLEYGKSCQRFDFIPTDAPLEPTSGYAASKAAFSVAATTFARITSLELYYGRVFSAFGEGQHESNFWPSLRRAAKSGEDFPMTAGEQIRDFIPVEQVAFQFLKACERTDLPPEDAVVENVGTGCPQTLRAFAEIWWQHWQATGQLHFGQIPYRRDDVLRCVPDLRN